MHHGTLDGQGLSMLVSDFDFDELAGRYEGFSAASAENQAKIGILGLGSYRNPPLGRFGVGTDLGFLLLP